MKVLSTENLRTNKPDRNVFRSLPRNPISIILDNLTSGFNVGSIFRISDAFLLEHMYLCGTTPQPPSHAITKTSIGTDKWVPWEYCSNAKETVKSLRSRGVQIVAAELTDKSVSLESLALPFPVGLIFGDEMLGVSREVLDEADASVAIPMFGMGNSLSVVSACAIIVHGLVMGLLDKFNCDNLSDQISFLRNQRG